MNRLGTLCQSDATGESLRRLGLDIHAGLQSPLTTDEYAWILQQLKSKDIADSTRRDLLYVSTLDKGYSSEIINYCESLLTTLTVRGSFSGYESAADMALQHVLAKSPDRQTWIEQIENSDSAVMRMVVAEHVVITDVHRGLMMMIETIPIVGTDHAVYDAICLWLGEKADARFLAAVESKLQVLKRTQPASALTKAFECARHEITGKQSAFLHMQAREPLVRRQIVKVTDEEK